MSNARIVIAALSLSAAGLVGIVAHEGYSDVAEPPVKGDVPTYGFGTTTHADGSPLRAGERTTPPQALGMALRDVQAKEGAIKRCVKVPLYQHEYDAYTSLAYNIGETAFCGSTLVKKSNQGDYDGACREILRWDMFQGKRCSAPENARLCGGIAKRRQSEYRQCMGAGQ